MNGTIRVVIGAIFGVAVGFAIYRYIGCRTGACPLSSNPFVAMGLWGLMGALMASGK
jgi:hypothetical protein